MLSSVDCHCAAFTCRKLCGIDMELPRKLDTVVAPFPVMSGM
jgi:hypothetical protein